MTASERIRDIDFGYVNALRNEQDRPEAVMVDTILARLRGKTMNVAFAMLLVHDLAAAESFYTDILGFTVVQKSEGSVHFKCGSLEFVAFPCERPAVRSEHAVDSCSAFVFAVDDIEASMADMKTRGVRFIHETPGVKQLGRYAAFYDPSGIVHEIFQRST